MNQFLIAADVSNNSNIQQPDGSYWICQNHLMGPPPSGSFSARVLRAVNNPCNSGQTSIIRVGNKYSFAPQRAAKLLYEKLKNGTWPTGGQSMLCQLYFSYSHIVSVLLSSTAKGPFIYRVSGLKVSKVIWLWQTEKIPWILIWWWILFKKGWEFMPQLTDLLNSDVSFQK